MEQYQQTLHHGDGEFDTLNLPLSKRQFLNLSSDQNLGWLGYIVDYTTQLQSDYDIIIIRIPINQPVYILECHGMSPGF